MATPLGSRTIPRPAFSPVDHPKGSANQRLAAQHAKGLKILQGLDVILQDFAKREANGTLSTDKKRSVTTLIMKRDRLARQLGVSS